MAFVVHPAFRLGRGSPARRHRISPRMCSRAWYPKTIDEIPASVRIALTREQGKNEALRSAVEEIYPDAEVLVWPCVETVPGSECDLLPVRLEEARSEPGWIVLTSPEAATIFIAGWRKARCPPVGRIAAVGKATGDKVRAVGLDIAFEPSKATGKTLISEFPVPTAEGEFVLYPSSAKASGEIVEGLSAKGFSVLRLNTYSTETKMFSDQDKYLAKGSHIVTFASPSAVKGWVSNVGVSKDIAVACIGETSAKAAKAAGFRQVHYPERPGIEGWISAICEAMKVYEATSVLKS